MPDRLDEAIGQLNRKEMVMLLQKHIGVPRCLPYGRAFSDAGYRRDSF